MDRSIVANVDGNMRTPGIVGRTKEQEIKRLILINGDDLGLGVATTKPCNVILPFLTASFSQSAWLGDESASFPR
jgi:hypothetical protein